MTDEGTPAAGETGRSTSYKPTIPDAHIARLRAWHEAAYDEMGIADDNYAALTRFIEQVPEHIQPAGRLLLSFGTTGDI